MRIDWQYGPACDDLERYACLVFLAMIALIADFLFSFSSERYQVRADCQNGETALLSQSFTLCDVAATCSDVLSSRNPFGYAPWNQKRTYEAMFETLEADIVIMQEAKIQRKDLTDDMVLVTGWDVFFSLPRDKKGRSSYVVSCTRLC